MSGSWIDHLGRYAATRFPAGAWLPLACFLALAGAAPEPRSLREWLWAVVLAVTVLFQLRLWDDLVDLPFDRVAHPDRVLSSARSLAPFWIVLALVLLVAVALAWWVGGLRAAAGLAALDGALLAWYGRGQPALGHPLLRAHVSLLKYPVLVLLLGVQWPGAFAGRRPVIALLVYLCFSIHELLHDPGLAGMRGARWLLAVEMTTLSAVPLVSAVGSVPVADTLPLCGAATVVAAAALLTLPGAARRHPGSHRVANLVFVVGVFELLTLYLGGGS